MRALVIAFLLAVLAVPVSGQSLDVEVGAHVETLSGPYADGRGMSLGVRLPVPQGSARFDAVALDRFGDRAVVFGVAGTRDLGRWIVTGGAGTSTGGVVNPRLQASLGVGRRWGARRQILTTLSTSFRDARDVHRDLDLAAEVAVYGTDLVVQGGGRLTLSQPGTAVGGAAHVALTVGDLRGRHATGRLTVGRAAYLLVEPAPLDVAFQNAAAQVGWHEPLGAEWGTTLRADLYVTPYYIQAGFRTSLIRRF